MRGSEVLLWRWLACSDKLVLAFFAASSNQFPVDSLFVFADLIKRCLLFTFVKSFDQSVKFVADGKQVRRRDHV